MQTESGSAPLAPYDDLAPAHKDRRVELSGAWQRAASADALVGSAPLGVQISGFRIALYRKADGTVAALDDRCPHRWAMLSQGRVDSDNIVCPAHGFKFCPKGKLVLQAGQSPAPGVSDARAFPVAERGGQIFIFLADLRPGAA